MEFAAERKRILALMASDFRAAERDADGLAARFPGEPAALVLQAYLANFGKDHAGAAGLLERALALAPGDAESAFNFAYCRLQSGDVARAADGFAPLASADARLLHWCCRRWLGERPELPAIAPGTPAGLAALHFAGRDDRLRSMFAQENAAAALVGWLNRYDVPGWGRLDDKASLAELLQSHAFRFAPETHWHPEGWPRADGRMWIAKHARLFGGQSVRIGRDPAALADDGWIVQRYIEDPMLREGRKFHLRLYLLIHGARALLFADGIARLAPFAYDRDDPDERRHITNTLRFKSDPEAASRTRVLALSDLNLAPDALQGLHDVARELTRVVLAERVRFAHLAPDADAIPPKILGLDVMLDADGGPWLLEVERYPALHGGSPAADGVNARLFREAARIVAGEAPDAGSWAAVA